jgi:outer membrane protein
MLLIAALSLGAYASDLAVIDSDRIFDSLGEVADARELLQTEIEEWQAHADSLQEEIDGLEDDLSRTLMMSPETRREKERLLEERQEELDSFISETFGPDGLVESRNEQLVSPIVASINEAVREVSTEEGYSLVLDASKGHVVFADPSIDITDDVIDRLTTRGED